MYTEPIGLATTSAATIRPSPKSRDAVPSPPFSTPAMAPRPAPTEPSSNSSPALANASKPRRRYGGSRPQSLSPPLARSCNTAAGTMGIAGAPGLRCRPTWSWDSLAATASAAPRPNTEPPAKTSAWSWPTMFSGSNAAVSRPPGPPPRMSILAVQKPSGRITVTPVSTCRSVAWPTVRPGISVRALRGPGLGIQKKLPWV